ncbi:MAG TPA: MFS transporter, partial [archaeon]|nr:MFS transporter [archaeon]
MDDNPNYKWKAMFVVSIGVFMATLDSSIINVSLPTLTAYFSTDITTIQWVILSYLLTITALLLTLGRISDIYGRKPVFILGLLIFTFGSGLCSFSTTSGQLIAFRVVQGLGAAMIMANGPAIITQVFPHTE